MKLFVGALGSEYLVKIFESRIPKRKSGPIAGQARGSGSQEVEKAEEEIRSLGLANYCSVSHFD